MSQIVNFYAGKYPNSSGKFISEVRHFSNLDLERRHDYIQWLFPLDVGSDYNPDAPILTKEDITELRDGNFGLQFLLSLETMLKFFGLQILWLYDYKANGQYVPIITFGDDDSFNSQFRYWISPYNHNYKRITRILKSLMLVGREKDAKAFLKFLKQLYEYFPDDIGKETFGYWCAAVPE